MLEFAFVVGAVGLTVGLVWLWGAARHAWHAGHIGWWTARTDRPVTARLRLEHHCQRLRALGWSDEEVDGLVRKATGDAPWWEAEDDDDATT